MPDPKPSPTPPRKHPLHSTPLNVTPTLSTDPARFEPFSMKAIEKAGLALWTARTNFTRLKARQPHEATKQFATINRYLKEQIYREAHAALCTAPDKDEFWDRQMERLIDWFNPPDEDAACESIVLDAIERAYKFAESQPCTCAARAGDVFDACSRCQVLGRIKNEAVQR